MKIHEFDQSISSGYKSVLLDTPIEEVYHAMTKDCGTPVLFVTDQDKKLKGLIEVGALLHIYGAKYASDVLTEFSSLLAKKARDIMTSPISVKREDPIQLGIQLMLETKSYDIPVVDNENKVIGSLNCFEVLEALRTKQNNG